MQAPNLFAPRSSLHRVHIRDSRIGALDLFDADLRSVTIADSKLGLVDLRGLRIDTIRNMGGMKGATIDAHQAVALAGQFAAHLGLRIEDLP
ncbi:hypothetical protein NXT08_07780 [Rhodococcus pyridinivorans]|uniref:hypothetical protein n=1 Tax=Rhodococcus pyridinivorans TaxID=103816 RepID=UPI002164C80C|nr:hypothetical protein [Rhodococcus pyridinivorans]UVT27482.1 hypothetical protein NXT08_07780 [Rhodococcus pyridinivorans]